MKKIITVSIISFALLVTIGFKQLSRSDNEHEDHTGHDHAQNEKESENHTVHEIDEHSEEEDHDEPQDVHSDDYIVAISTEAAEMAGITVSKVRLGKIKKSLTIPGEVGFNEDRKVHITPRFAGIAREANFRVGDFVKTGDVLAIVESNESMNTYSVKSPISGRIIQKHAAVGEFVSNEESMYFIADLSNVWVNLAVYPKDAGEIKPGLNVTITAIGTAINAEGSIDYITPVLDATTRSMTARVVIANRNNLWRPGTFVQAKITIESGNESIVVESDAVQILNEKSVVFVPEGESEFKPVEVITGDSNGQLIEIISGLEAGMAYASTGAFELKAKIVTSSLGEHAGHGH